MPISSRSGRSRKYPAKSFVDFQNDVTATDVTLAKQEGFSAVEHLKRYTTLGMATDQGKTANVNGLGADGAKSPAKPSRRPAPRASARLTRRLRIGALAGPHRGKHFKPARLTPTHDFATRARRGVRRNRAVAARAVFSAPGRGLAAPRCIREVNTVRNAVGICDVTTLGKIDIQGPDAAKFLECVYTNSWANLTIGRARYGLMLREDGFVMDDGTCARLGETHFVMTTTTANAGESLAASGILPPDPVAGAGCVIHFRHRPMGADRGCRPASRAACCENIVDPPFDISNEAFPYMGAQRAHHLRRHCGAAVPALFFRRTGL